MIRCAPADRTVAVPNATSAPTRSTSSCSTRSNGCSCNPTCCWPGEHSIAVTAPVPDDQLLAAELARLNRKLDAADTEKRRLVDLYQAGLIEMADLQRRTADVATRHRQLQAKRTSLAEQRTALARGNHVEIRLRIALDQPPPPDPQEPDRPPHPNEPSFATPPTVKRRRFAFHR